MSGGSNQAVTKARDRVAAGGVDDTVTDALVHVIEAEILPRLLLLYQEADLEFAPTHLPTLEDADRLHALLLAPDSADFDAEVAHLLGADMTLDTLLDDLLIPAARRLGALWDEDVCELLAVTEGLGRLQILTRHLVARLEADAPQTEHSILLLPCPGEAHFYALSIVAAYFRKADWHVMILDPAKPDAADLLRKVWFDAVGLSLACDMHLPVLKDTVDALRRASRNPTLAVIVGGPFFARHGAEAQAVGADACMADAPTAPLLAKALLDRRQM